MTLILSQVTIMSETEEINSGMLKAQDLSYHSPKQWFQNKLATARIPPAT